MTPIQYLRLVTLVVASLDLSLALVAIKNSAQLRRSQPDGMIHSGVNELAYLAVAIACGQVIWSQLYVFNLHLPFHWYGPPALLLWLVLFFVWFVRRVLWHRHVLHGHH